MGRMIFKPAARYPADPRAVFILALSVFSGLTALAFEVAPGSMEDLLPKWAVILWSVLLATGSLTALIGMSRQTVNGIIIEQVGSVTVGVTAIFYSILAMGYVGFEAVQTIGLIFAWGVACLIRWAQLQVLIHDAMKRGAKREFLTRFEAEVQAYAERHRRQRSRDEWPDL